ncbi:MAG: gamma carbonic anhydrase family protein [Sporolactobacillus sp.]
MYRYGRYEPKIDSQAFVAPGAQIIGQVKLAAHSSIWFNAVLRGDEAGIIVGAGSNIQDGTIVHVDTGTPCTVGRNVTVGHRAILHGCTIEDGAMIGMGATILNRAVIEAGALVAAGSLVLEGQIVKAGTLVAGIPAKEKRKLNQKNIDYLVYDAKHYQEQAERYRAMGIGQ